MSPEEQKRFDAWIERFSAVMAVALDQSFNFQKAVSPSYGISLEAFLGPDWEKKHREMMQKLIKEAITHLQAENPDFAQRVLRESIDPEQVALALAPKIAADMYSSRN